MIITNNTKTYIGCTSWLKPGTYFENAKLIEKDFDFVELLVFEWTDDTKKLFQTERDRLLNLDLFYTLHLPDNDIKDCQACYDFFNLIELPIRNYVLHPIQGYEKFLEDNHDVTLENLIEITKPYENMTLDIGHLMINGNSDWLESTTIRSIKEIHLHGVTDNKDHKLLNEATLKFYNDIVKPILNKNEYIKEELLLNFEIFDYNDLIKSVELFK